MSGTLSTTVGLLGYAALGIYAQPGSAVSSAAETVEHVASDLARFAERSQALFGNRTTAISTLQDLANECAEADWDGAGAHAIIPLAVLRAERFLRALPDNIPMPDCSPEPDGSISLDWSAARNRLFSISVSSNDRLAFAWLDGSDRGHGVARFDGLAVPRVLLDLWAILNHGHASVRAA
jgi:hypothetical protein